METERIVFDINFGKNSMEIEKELVEFGFEFSLADLSHNKENGFNQNLTSPSPFDFKMEENFDSPTSFGEEEGDSFFKEEQMNFTCQGNLNEFLNSMDSVDSIENYLIEDPDFSSSSSSDDYPSPHSSNSHTTPSPSHEVNWTDQSVPNSILTQENHHQVESPSQSSIIISTPTVQSINSHLQEVSTNAIEKLNTSSHIKHQREESIDEPYSPSSSLSSPFSDSSSTSPTHHTHQTTSDSHLVPTCGLSSKPSKIQIGKGISLELNEEDLVSLDLDQIAKMAGTKFTKAEEKELKRLRRKARNKVSAAQSRQKKKDYVVGLEERIESVTMFNLDLKKQLSEMEKFNQLLKDQVQFLISHVDPTIQEKVSATLDNNISNGKEREENVKASKTSKSSNSLLSQLHKTQSKSSVANGTFLMIFFLSFGFFFQFLSFPTFEPTSPQTSTISPSIGRFLNEFHHFDSFSQESDSINCSSDDDNALWDAFYEAELQTNDLAEKYKHEIIYWNDCKSSEIPNSVQDEQENIVCTGAMCLVGIEDSNDLFK